MTNLESLISRYLDGELSLAEQEKVRRLLEESSEARSLLHEMTAITHAARRTPGLHRPNDALESRLFQRLRAEGLYADRPPVAGTGRPGAVAPLWRGAAVAALLLVLLAGGGYWLSNMPGTPSPVAAVSSADVPAPSVTGNDKLAHVPAPAGESRGFAASTSRRAERSGGGGSRTIVHASSERTAGAVPPVDAPSFAFSIPVPDDLEWESSPSANVESHARPIVQPEVTLATDSPSRRVGRSESPSIVASIRSGMTYIDHGAGEQGKELTFRVGVELGGGHQVAIVGGSSPALTETRHTNTGVMLMAQYSGASSKHYLESAPAEHSVELHNEAWMGVGYRYTFPAGILPRPLRDLHVGIGADAGVGTRNTAFRVGGEISVGRTIVDGVSVELAGTVSNVTPRDRKVEEFTIFDSPDAYVYNGATQNQAFVSYGLQLGVRVDIK